MRKIFALLSICCFMAFGTARAVEQQFGRNNIRLTFEGASGALKDGEAFYDYLARLQLSRMLPNRWNLGLIYSYDRSAQDGRRFAKDAFSYVETEWGRLEAGWTESIAAKLALKLPDVGGTRLNNAPFFLPEDFTGITHPAVRGNQYAWRLSMATLPTRPLQIGMGRTIAARHFESSYDIGIKYRNPHGRVKSSAAVGFSYIEKPNGLSYDSYLPPVFADARYQGTLGFNLQWGSLLWAATAKAVVDEAPRGLNSEGLQLGTGFSYDFLAFSISANYIFSDIGLWRAEIRDVAAHTGIFSARYKIHKNFNVWGSVGAVMYDEAIYGGAEQSWFGSAGIGVTF